MPGLPLQETQSAAETDHVEKERQRIVLAIGLPGCGKSTWFEKQSIVPLSSDELRTLLADDVNEQRFQVEIFSALRFLLSMRLEIGRPVNYVDATNLRRMHRDTFLRLAVERNCRIEAVYFDVPLEICLERNRSRSRQVPEDVMRAMSAGLEPPAFEEGFCRITVVGPSGETLRDEHQPSVPPQGQSVQLK